MVDWVVKERFETCNGKAQDVASMIVTTGYATAREVVNNVLFCFVESFVAKLVEESMSYECLN